LPVSWRWSARISPPGDCSGTRPAEDR
jgi:hypothetical protein